MTNGEPDPKELEAVRREIVRIMLEILEKEPGKPVPVQIESSALATMTGNLKKTADEIASPIKAIQDELKALAGKDPGAAAAAEISKGLDGFGKKLESLNKGIKDVHERAAGIPALSDIRAQIDAAVLAGTPQAAALPVDLSSLQDKLDAIAEHLGIGIEAKPEGETGSEAKPETPSPKNVEGVEKETAPTPPATPVGTNDTPANDGFGAKVTAAIGNPFRRLFEARFSGDPVTDALYDDPEAKLGVLVDPNTPRGVRTGTVIFLVFAAFVVGVVLGQASQPSTSLTNNSTAPFLELVIPPENNTASIANTAVEKTETPDEQEEKAVTTNRTEQVGTKGKNDNGRGSSTRVRAGSNTAEPVGTTPTPQPPASPTSTPAPSL